MKRDKFGYQFGKYENSRLLHSRFEIIIAWMERDRLIEWMCETRQGGIKRSMHKLYRARFWCTRDDRLVSLFFATRFDPIDRYSHFLPCAASRTHELRLSQWDTCVAARFLTPNNWIPTSGRGSVCYTRWNSSDIERVAINR